MRKPHPSDAHNAQAIQRASYFTVVLLVQGRQEKLELKTLGQAREAKPLLETIHGGSRRALIYAVTPDGLSHMVPDSYHTDGA